MKAKFNSNMESGRQKAKYLLWAAVLLALVTIFFTRAGTAANTVLFILTMAAIAASLIVVYKDCRCPYCGRHIFMGVFRITVCPACHRNLYSGKFVKKHER